MTTPGTGPGSSLGVDPAALTGAAGILDGVAVSLSGRGGGLHLQPDAGASSGEVVSALDALAGAVAAVAEEVRGVGDAIRTSVADFTGTDQAVSDSLPGRVSP